MADIFQQPLYLSSHILFSLPHVTAQFVLKWILKAQLQQDDIPLILENCNYSEYFIKTANDLQIMDAINSCYEEYKILKKNK